MRPVIKHPSTDDDIDNAFAVSFQHFYKEHIKIFSKYPGFNRIVSSMTTFLGTGFEDLIYVLYIYFDI